LNDHPLISIRVKIKPWLAPINQLFRRGFTQFIGGIALSKLIFDFKIGNNEKIEIEGGMGGTKGS
jgi:hypothetical protein